MSAPKIHDFRCVYRRNGAAGESFHLCSFAIHNGRSRQYLRAILFDAPGHCAVTSADIHETWRGDEFEAELRRLIAAVEVKV